MEREERTIRKKEGRRKKAKRMEREERKKRGRQRHTY